MAAILSALHMQRADDLIELIGHLVEFHYSSITKVKMRPAFPTSGILCIQCK
jgi:hypothetical protein